MSLGRQRVIKPEWAFSEFHKKMSDPAQIAFAYLACHADRHGRLKDKPAKLKSVILPYHDVDFDAVLNEMQNASLIVRYVREGQKTIQILAFSEHHKPHPDEVSFGLPEVLIDNDLEISPEISLKLLKSNKISCSREGKGIGRGKGKGRGREEGNARGGRELGDNGGKAPKRKVEYPPEALHIREAWISYRKSHECDAHRLDDTLAIGGQGMKNLMEAWKSEGRDWTRVAETVDRYWDALEEKENYDFVKNFANFFGREKIYTSYLSPEGGAVASSQDES